VNISNIWVGEAGFSLKHALRIVAVFLVLASLPVAYGAWLRERDLTTMRTQGIDTVAAVIRGFDDRSERGYGRRYTVHHDYHLTLRWTDQVGRTQTYTRLVYPSLFFRMADASPDARQIAIRYLPGRPDVQPFIATEPTEASNLYLYAAVALVALGLGAAWLGWPPRPTVAMAKV